MVAVVAAMDDDEATDAYDSGEAPVRGGGREVVVAVVAVAVAAVVATAAAVVVVGVREMGWVPLEVVAAVILVET